LSHGQEDADLQRARISGLVWTSKKIVNFGRSEVIFTQGDLCGSVMYIQHGGVKLSVLSTLSEMVGNDALARRSWGPDQQFASQRRPARLNSPDDTILSGRPTRDPD
jgi:hypothetical protein